MDRNSCREKRLRVAAIDIGTNTLLLLIADVDEKGGIEPLHEEQRIPRLGAYVDERGIIPVSAFDRISWILNEYANLARQMKAEKIFACATSAVRDAENREEFLDYIKKNTGLLVNVLSGHEEASLAFSGALSGFPGIRDGAAVLDIGGGSTEVSYLSGGELLSRSFPIGCVRLTERHFKTQPPSRSEIEAASKDIEREFRGLKESDFRGKTLIAVAGTATTLACLDQGLAGFSMDRVSGYKISGSSVQMWLFKLALLGTPEILGLSDAASGRADILLAGVLILSRFMERSGFQEVMVSERGLRYGLALAQWQKTSA